MKITIDSRLRIKDPSLDIEKWCEDNLILDNPDYYKLERMGKWTGNTPQKLWLFERLGDELWLPFGCLRDVWRICGKNAAWNNQISPIRPVLYQSHISLYPYQEKAVNEAIKQKNGVLVMPCGSGKTQCGLEIISRIGGRALWLTHTQDLLNQSAQRAESVFDQGGYGFITGGAVDIGTSITFATVQTLSKLDLSQYCDQWDVIIADECQHVAGSPTKVTQFYKVISRLSARYKIGLTATPKRADNLERAMYALLGDKIHEVTRDEVAHTTCPIRVEIVPTNWFADLRDVLMGDGTINYSQVIEAMVSDDNRYETVLSRIARLDGTAIILANRVKYLQKLAYSLQYYDKKCICLSDSRQSKKAKAERKAALEALNNGELDCIFCTYQLAAEGLDIPNLRYVVFATPEKDPTRVQQASGRVGRKAKGKDYGTVIDFVDSFGMYKSWQKKREAVYKKLGYDII